jgi:ubiquinone/menaquinone biosynthesis C-methylase UbiE
MHVADFGCGVGAMTRNLAEMVGPAGSATAVDLYEPQLAQAADLCARCGLSNVSFWKADARNTGLPDNIFDLVYCRFLLIHLPDPSACLREMKRILRPGGIVFVEDGELSSGKIDYELGRDLYHLVKRARFEDVEIDICPPACSRRRDQMETVPDNPDILVLMPRMSQVWGRKAR